MKSQLVFLLVTSLVLAGIPNPSRSEGNPKAVPAQEKAALSALNAPDLLRQKAGEIIQAAEKMDPDTKDFFKKMEAQNPWLLSQKAGDGSVPPADWSAYNRNTSNQPLPPLPSLETLPPPQKSGLSTTGAVFIAIGAVATVGLAALAVAFVDNLHNLNLGDGGGSC
jgi:hypothetical protein